MTFSSTTFGGFAALLFLSVVTGQGIDRNAAIPPCNQLKTLAGTGLAGHPTYCSMFINCDTAGTQTLSLCPENTVFNSDLGVCVHPFQSSNDACRCTAGSATLTFPHECCKLYYQCDGATGVSIKECTSGQVYSSQNRACVQNFTGACADNPKCRALAPTGMNQDARINCSRTTVPNNNNNPCNYIETVGGVVYNRQCPSGTAFNATACSCTTLDPTCPRKADTDSPVKIPDSECKASLKFDAGEIKPGTNQPQVKTDKPTPNTNIDVYIATQGINYNNNFAVLATNQITQAPANFYIPRFNNNQLSMNVLFVIAFRSTQIGRSFTLFSTNFRGTCNPTVEVNGTFNGNTYNINAVVVGARNANLNQNTSATSLQFSASQQDVIQVTLYLNGVAVLSAKNLGPQGTNTFASPSFSQPGQFVGNYQANQCGLEIGNGLDGQIKSFSVHEGCLDATRITGNQSG